MSGIADAVSERRSDGAAAGRCMSPSRWVVLLSLSAAFFLACIQAAEAAGRGASDGGAARLYRAIRERYGVQGPALLQYAVALRVYGKVLESGGIRMEREHQPSREALDALCRLAGTDYREGENPHEYLERVARTLRGMSTARRKALRLFVLSTLPSADRDGDRRGSEGGAEVRDEPDGSSLRERAMIGAAASGGEDEVLPLSPPDSGAADEAWVDEAFIASLDAQERRLLSEALAERGSGPRAEALERALASAPAATAGDTSGSDAAVSAPSPGGSPGGSGDAASGEGWVDSLFEGGDWDPSLLNLCDFFAVDDGDSGGDGDGSERVIYSTITGEPVREDEFEDPFDEFSNELANYTEENVLIRKDTVYQGE